MVGIENRMKISWVKREIRLQIHCREKTDWLLSLPGAHLGKYVI